MRRGRPRTRTTPPPGNALTRSSRRCPRHARARTRRLAWLPCSGDARGPATRRPRLGACPSTRWPSAPPCARPGCLRTSRRVPPRDPAPETPRARRGPLPTGTSRACASASGTSGATTRATASSCPTKTVRICTSCRTIPSTTTSGRCSRATPRRVDLAARGPRVAPCPRDRGRSERAPEATAASTAGREAERRLKTARLATAAARRRRRRRAKRAAARRVRPGNPRDVLGCPRAARRHLRAQARRGDASDVSARAPAPETRARASGGGGGGPRRRRRPLRLGRRREQQRWERVDVAVDVAVDAATPSPSPRAFTLAACSRMAIPSASRRARAAARFGPTPRVRRRLARGARTDEPATRRGTGDASNADRLDREERLG